MEWLGKLCRTYTFDSSIYKDVFFLVPVRQCIEADRICAETQMKADNNLSDGSSRKTFMTTPVVLNSVTWENTGGCGELSPEGPSENASLIRTNSMTRSSSKL